MKHAESRQRQLSNRTFGYLGLAVLLGGCSDVRYRDGIVAQGPVQQIQIEGDVGVIDLVPSKTAKVEYAVRAPEGVANVQGSETDGVLRTSARCSTPVLCAVDMQVHVPVDVGVSVDFDVGEVWSTGVGQLSVRVGQGEIDVDTTGNVTLQVGQGSVRVKTTGSESVRVAVGDGDIMVEAAPDRWSLNVTAESQANEGLIDDPLAVGQMELVAPAGLVTMKPVNRTEDSGTP